MKKCFIFSFLFLASLSPWFSSVNAQEIASGQETQQTYQSVIENEHCEGTLITTDLTEDCIPVYYSSVLMSPTEAAEMNLTFCIGDSSEQLNLLGITGITLSGPGCTTFTESELESTYEFTAADGIYTFYTKTGYLIFTRGTPVETESATCGSATATPCLTQDSSLAFGIMMLLVIISIAFIAYLYNSIKQKKPWQH